MGWLVVAGLHGKFVAAFCLVAALVGAAPATWSLGRPPLWVWLDCAQTYFRLTPAAGSSRFYVLLLRPKDASGGPFLV